MLDINIIFTKLKNKFINFLLFIWMNQKSEIYICYIGGFYILNVNIFHPHLHPSSFSIYSLSFSFSFSFFEIFWVIYMLYVIVLFSKIFFSCWLVLMPLWIIAFFKIIIKIHKKLSTRKKYTKYLESIHHKLK